MRTHRPMPGSCRGPHWQRGLTVVELMIAMALSMMIVAALVTLVVNMGRANRELDRSSRQIENGRYAIDLLAEEVRLGGYFGDVAQAVAVRTDPDPCATVAANLGWVVVPLTVPKGLEGRSGVGDVPACVGNHLAATGILVLRRLSVAETAAAAVPAGTVHVQASNCNLDPFATPIIVNSAAAAFTLRVRDCTVVNTVRRYVSRIYFVAGCSDCGTDTIPTLKRLELVGAALQEIALAEGIEEVQYEYGFDTDNNGKPDQYLIALDGVGGSPMNNWANVMAVRIWLISRATEPTIGFTDTKTYTLGLHGVRGPFNDQFKRRLYSSLVMLPNPSGLRE